jgi:hypothetical protein
MFAGAAGYTPAEIKAMSLYEFRCVQAGWVKANTTQKEKAKILTPDQFDEIIARQSAQPEPTRVLSPEEFLAMHKDRVTES